MVCKLTSPLVSAWNFHKFMIITLTVNTPITGVIHDPTRTDVTVKTLVSK